MDILVDVWRCLFQYQRPEIRDFCEGGLAVGVEGLKKGILGAYYSEELVRVSYLGKEKERIEGGETVEAY